MSEPERWYRDAEHDPIHTDAADWFTRLQCPDLDLKDVLEWQSWMSADGRHAEAFRRIEDVWNQFDPLEAEKWRLVKEPDPKSFDGTIAISDWHSGQKQLPRKALSARSARRLRFALAASVSAALVGLLLLVTVSSGSLWSDTVADATETSIGENRVLTLADGSQITLGGDTRVTVDLGESERNVHLARGEAYFTVARDTSRPFIVRAGEATVTALGTAFNVRRNSGRVVVAVVEGRVSVEPVRRFTSVDWLRLNAEKHDPLRLDAGQQAAIQRSEIGPVTVLANPSAATAWQTGHLTFEGEPLRYVLEAVNRYARKPIEAGDATVAELTITGTVANDNLEGWIKSLESAFALEAVEESDRIVLTPEQ